MYQQQCTVGKVGFELFLSIHDLENLPFKERRKLIKNHPNPRVDNTSPSNLVWDLKYIFWALTWRWHRDSRLWIEVCIRPKEMSCDWEYLYALLSQKLCTIPFPSLWNITDWKTSSTIQFVQACLERLLSYLSSSLHKQSYMYPRIFCKYPGVSELAQ